MEASIPTHQKNVGTFIHLSTFSKYFFPFGNFIAPLILWSAQKRDSAFIDEHGRGAINFQLSLFLYLISLVVISIPFFVFFAISAGNGSESLIKYGYINDPTDFADLSGFLITGIIVGVIALGIFVLEIISVISAAVTASKGELYRYPFTINFIKKSEALVTSTKKADPSAASDSDVTSTSADTDNSSI